MARSKDQARRHDTFTAKDAACMRRALGLAEQGRGLVSPNPMVGAVVVKGGCVVGEGCHGALGGPHAEVMALERAAAHAKGATLYVTLEPCSTTGRTPPCTEIILAAGVKRVVAGMADPNPRHGGRGLRLLERAGVDVRTGLLADEIARQNEVFVRYMRSHRPFVTLKCAASLDGKVAAARGRRTCISGREAGRLVHRMRAESDAIMVGLGTVLADDPKLTARGVAGSGPDGAARGGGRPGRYPWRVVADSRARIPFDSYLVRTAQRIPTWVAVTEKAPRRRVKALIEAGVGVIETETGGSSEVGLPELMTALADMEVSSVLLEGGPRLASSMAAADLVDKYVFILSPRLFGGDDVPGLLARSLPEAGRLEVSEIARAGDDIVVTACPAVRRGH